VLTEKIFNLRQPSKTHLRHAQVISARFEPAISLGFSTAIGARLSSARNPPLTIRKTDRNLVLCPSEIFRSDLLYSLVASRCKFNFVFRTVKPERSRSEKSGRMLDDRSMSDYDGYCFYGAA
jgi:hypothetical protein